MIDTARSERMPALLLAHGNPMNALADTAFTPSLATLAASLPRPEAILVVSAQWLTGDTRASTAAAPRTVHDFGGSPQASTRSGIRLRARLCTPRVSGSYSLRLRRMTPGVSITSHGPSCVTCGREPTFRRSSPC
jgi:hypothetical protein